jgi:hypothetical protein
MLSIRFFREEWDSVDLKFPDLAFLGGLLKPSLWSCFGLVYSLLAVMASCIVKVGSNASFGRRYVGLEC